MDFTKEQLSELICKHSEKENGLQDLMEIMIESMMVTERREYLHEDGLPGDKGNGFRVGHTYGQGRTLTFRIPRDRYGNFHPRILAVLRSQEEECLDTCFSSDMYGIPSELNRESKVGNGLMLLDDDRMSSSLFNKMVCICKNETIDYHLYYHPWMEKKGINAYSIANNYPGLPVGSVLLPCSAMHTPLEMMSLQDIEQEEHLLYSFIVSMKL